MRLVAALAMLCACASPRVQDALLADRDRGDVTAIRTHAWALWERLSGGAWDTWAPTERLFAGASATARPRFRTPRPFRNGETIETETLPVMFDVLFDPHAAAHIRANRLAIEIGTVSPYATCGA